MRDDSWDAVDAYTTSLLQPPDPVLEAAIRESASLPNIAVSPAQGQFLHLLARAIHARRILEIGTLGGYSAIWMSRALPDDGRLISLELDEHHAEVARANIARAGGHVTLASYGPMVKVCLDAANAAAEEGKSIEVIDLRSLSPLDLDTVATSVEKTGRLVVAHEASTFLGMGAEIAAAISQRCFYSLESPVIRVGGYNLPYPPSRLEEEFLPDLDRVLDGVDRALAY